MYSLSLYAVLLTGIPSFHSPVRGFDVRPVRSSIRGNRCTRTSSFFPPVSPLLLSSSVSPSPETLQQPKASEDYSNFKQPRQTTYQRNQLQRLVKSVESIQQNGTECVVSDEVVQALIQLSAAKTSSQVTEAGRYLDQVVSSQTCQSLEAQESVVQAATLTGLFPLALKQLHEFFLEKDILPSSALQINLCSNFRKARRYSDLEQTMMQLGKVAVLQNQSLSVTAFDIYLASLMDQAGAANKNSGPQFLPNNANHTDYLDQLWRWVITDRGQTELGVVPDSVSYATILNAAAKAGNRTMSDQIWTHMTNHTAPPKPKNTIAYNARLKALTSLSNNRPRDDALALELWQEMKDIPAYNNNDEARDHIEPDPFTIDLMLLVWVRQEKEQRLSPGFAWKQIQSALNDLCHQDCYTPDAVSQAFRTYLVRLTKGGAITMARALFQKYLLPSCSKVVEGGSTERLFWIEGLQSAHFNILLEGYRKVLRGNTGKNSHESDSNRMVEWIEANVTGHVERFNVKDEAWDLFQIMQGSSRQGISPDSFTITIMMGMCYSPSDLYQMLALPTTSDEGEEEECGSILETYVNSSPFLRAAMTRFGELGDLPSAYWLFMKYGKPNHQRKLRLWNVLLGSAAKSCASANYFGIFNISDTSLPKTGSENKREEHDSAILNHPLTLELEGKSYPEAAEILLTFMNSRGRLWNDIIAPPPDSQSYCLVASSLQCTNMESDRVLNFFRESQQQGIPADGRFVNALLRCFGENVMEAISAWKSEIRPACLQHEMRYRNRPLPAKRTRGKNLLAAYHGLLYCCGRALRPDLAVRLVYAMRKEGLSPSEISLYSYNAGKRERPEARFPKNSDFSLLQKVTQKVTNTVASKPWGLVAPYESVLYVECTEYNQNDSRQRQEKRVRIII